MACTFVKMKTHLAGGALIPTELNEDDLVLSTELIMQNWPP